MQGVVDGLENIARFLASAIARPDVERDDLFEADIRFRVVRHDVHGAVDDIRKRGVRRHVVVKLRRRSQKRLHFGACGQRPEDGLLDVEKNVVHAALPSSTSSVAHWLLSSLFITARMLKTRAL